MDQRAGQVGRVEVQPLVLVWFCASCPKLLVLSGTTWAEEGRWRGLFVCNEDTWGRGEERAPLLIAWGPAVITCALLWPIKLASACCYDYLLDYVHSGDTPVIDRDLTSHSRPFETISVPQSCHDPDDSDCSCYLDSSVDHWILPDYCTLSPSTISSLLNSKHHLTLLCHRLSQKTQSEFFFSFSQVKSFLLIFWGYSDKNPTI